MESIIGSRWKPRLPQPSGPLGILTTFSGVTRPRLGLRPLPPDESESTDRRRPMPPSPIEDELLLRDQLWNPSRGWLPQQKSDVESLRIIISPPLLLLLLLHRLMS